MKLLILMALAASVVICVSNAHAQKSISGEHDISELLASAKERFDLSQEDAVLLFDGSKVEWMPDGRLVSSVHRIIWINTGVAIRSYGDHRIPYDESRCNFNVHTVRTWRDGQWWETGPTGIVETLPYRMRQAYDYANMREMMLLHNGIELPCILEIAYSIEDREPFRTGAEGIWTFAREEPAMQSRFCLGLPIGEKPNNYVSEGVPQPDKVTDAQLGLDIYTWMMGPIDAVPRPRTADPAAHVPHIAWSTWKNWDEYGEYLKGTFESAMSLDTSLARHLDSLLEKARTDGEKADLIAEFINERTRFINYPEQYWWPSPRPAVRTYTTAYGHRLDRAILAAAMFREAGIETNPVFLGKGYGGIDEGAPTLSRMVGVGVWLSGGNLEAYYDPARGSVSNGPARIYNRTFWIAGSEDKPGVRLGSEDELSLMEVRIDLSFDEEKDMFMGTGYFHADNGFNPYDRMEGLAGEAKACLGSVVSGVLEGAKVTGYNPSSFDRTGITVGFELELKKPEPDDLGRVSLIVGEPSGGISDKLPDNLRLFHQIRRSPVYLPCLMAQKVELRLDMKGLELVYHPSNSVKENSAGTFSLAVKETNNKLTIERQLNLAKTEYQSEDWADLWTLLLADRHEHSRTLLLKTTKGDKDDKDKKEDAE